MTINIEQLENTDYSDVAEGKLNPVHPGEILLHDFLKPMGISQYRLAKEIGVPQRRISEIVSGKRSITPNTGLRLSRFFGMNNTFWIGLQADYDVSIAKESLRDTLASIRPITES